MLGGLFARNRAPVVPTVLEPVKIPGQEKRQEKERRWIESISYRGRHNNLSGGTLSKQPLPAPVEHIFRATAADEKNNGLLLSPDSHINASDGEGGRQHARSSSASSTGSIRGRLLDRWTGNSNSNNNVRDSSITSHRRAQTAGSTSTSTSLMSRWGTIRSKSRDRGRQKTQETYTSSPAPAKNSSTLLDAAGIGVGHDRNDHHSDGGVFVHVPRPSPHSLLQPPTNRSHNNDSLNQDHNLDSTSTAPSFFSENDSFQGQRQAINGPEHLAPPKRRPSATTRQALLSSNRAKSVYLHNGSSEIGTSTGSQSHPDLPSTSALVPGQGSSSSSPSASAPPASKQNTSKSLALRLQELEHANTVGLLDDDEYRVLRQHLFETRTNPNKSALESLQSLQSGLHMASPAIDEFGSLGTQSQDRNGLLNEQSAGKASIQRTGTLLGLQRLNMGQGDTRQDASHAETTLAPPPPPIDPEPAQLLPPSSSSTRSRSGKLSLRSARSNLTIRSTASRLSHIFRRAASTPASVVMEEGYSTSAERPPLPNRSALRATGLATSASEADLSNSSTALYTQEGKKQGKLKGSIPNDWKILQQQHAPEAGHDARKGPPGGSASVSPMPRHSTIHAGDRDLEDTEIEIRLGSQYRTMRKGSISARRTSMYQTAASSKSTSSLPEPEENALPTASMPPRLTGSHSDPVLSEYLRDNSRKLPRIPSASFEPDTSTDPSTTMAGAADATITPSVANQDAVQTIAPMRVRPRRSDSRLTSKTSHSSEQSRVSTVRMETIVQPGDDLLSSKELRHAIDALVKENEVLTSQFSELQNQLSDKYGDPSLDALQVHAQHRRDSMVLQLEAARRLSTSSSANSAHGRSSVGHGSHQLGPDLPTLMSRRPSKASSIASSSMRRNLSSGSTQPSTFDTHITTRPPSTVQEELLFADIDAIIGADMWNNPTSDNMKSRYNQELRELQERRQKVTERYTARLEYLEARLQGQLIKEKLRR